MKNNLILFFLLPFVTFIIFTSLLFISDTDAQIISQSVTTINDYVQSNQNHRSIGGSFLTFSEIIRQKTNGNQVQQCPCVRPPGVNRCISYDSRFQGASIEEAILTFVDTSMDPRIYDDRIGGPI
uniref:Uncharacterized protein n=1 Tax=Panagrolaimus superbus TaxID=310955 RepID=A0A914YP54_9BILA